MVKFWDNGIGNGSGEVGVVDLMVFNGSFNGWKATIGDNGTAMDFHPSNSMKRQWFSIVDNHKGKNTIGDGGSTAL